MNGKAKPPGTARIMVTVETTEDATFRVELAAALAKGLNLELSAALIEQQALYDLARLPLAREVLGPSGEIQPLNASTLGAAARRHEIELRRRLTRLGELGGFAWSLFRLRLTAAGEDLLQPGSPEDILALPPHLCRFCAQGSLLIVPSTWAYPLRPGPIVWLVETESESCPPAVERIAEALSRNVECLTLRQLRNRRMTDRPGKAPAMIATHRSKGPAPQAAKQTDLVREFACPLLLLELRTA